MGGGLPLLQPNKTERALMGTVGETKGDTAPAAPLLNLCARPKERGLCILSFLPQVGCADSRCDQTAHWSPRLCSQQTPCRCLAGSDGRALRVIRVAKQHVSRQDVLGCCLRTGLGLLEGVLSKSYCIRARLLTFKGSTLPSTLGRKNLGMLEIHPISCPEEIICDSLCILTQFFAT